MRNHRPFARHSESLGTRRTPATYSSRPAGILSGTSWAIASQYWGGCCEVHTMDGTSHLIPGKWDLIIAHPPCTDLSVSGARWFAEKQKDGRQQKAIVFFMQMALAECDRVAVENPVCIMSSAWRKPNQIIQPWQFGHGEIKATCLWLKGLPPLVPTDIVDGRDQRVWKMPPSPDRAKERSKTYPGIAKAMAEQWGGRA